MIRTEECKDLAWVAQFVAAQESVQWIYENARGAEQFGDRNAVADYALDRAFETFELGTGVALVAEFGCYTGTMTRHLWRRLSTCEYHAFDSFRGVPGHEPFAIAPGSFDLGGKVPPSLPAGVLVHAGTFENTLPAFRAGMLGRPLAFAYIDCDLYPAVRCVLDNIEPLLVNGSIVVFDDWYNFPNWREHSHKAARECCDITFEPIATSSRGHAVAFQVSR